MIPFSPHASPSQGPMQRYLCVCCVLISVISGCTTFSSVPDARQDRDAHIVPNVPFYPQEDFQCGPASLAAVLNYRGISVTPEQIAKDVYSSSARATLNIDMLFYAQSRGLAASQYQGGMDDLREKVDAGSPLIVLVDFGFSIVQLNHYMVIVGYDGRGVIANSGGKEMMTIPAEDFLKSWGKTKFWTLFITRK